jgi:hypothetical protein
MQEHTLDGQGDRPVVIDLCEPCQSFWFDARESLLLTPGATLTLFRIIGERVTHPQLRDGDTSKCPRCKARLRRTQDMQRTTRFEYFKCPNNHGRLTTFFDFLKEKDFIRPLTPTQLAELRRNVQMVNCSNCGGPIDLAKGSQCPHCASPLSMLDLKQAGAIIEQLQRAEARERGPVDPALPLNLLRARRETDAAFEGVPDEHFLFAHVTDDGLVSSGLTALARWLKSRR